MSIENYPPGSNTKDAPWNTPYQRMIECVDCGGSGFIGHDCGEDSCCCMEPEDNIECDLCDGEGNVEMDSL